MAKFAPIGPPHLLKRIRDEWGDNILGDYHLVLAHDVVENQKLWRDGQILPEGSTVIVDNSIIELGRPVHAEVMKEAADILGDRYKRVVVLPDKFDDSYETYVQGLRWLGFYKRQNIDAEYMYVIQARRLYDVSFQGLYPDVRELVKGGVQWFSPPRRITDRFGTRMFLLHTLQQLKLKWAEKGFKIHLLGFSERVIDDLLCCRQWGVEGIDSAVPVRLGQKGIRLDVDFVGDQAGPRGTFWTDQYRALDPTLKRNLLLVRDYIDPEVPIDDPHYTPRIKGEWL